MAVETCAVEHASTLAGTRHHTGLYRVLITVIDSRFCLVWSGLVWSGLIRRVPTQKLRFKFLCPWQDLDW